MLQIVVQRAFPGSKTPVFVYPEPRLPLVTSSMELFRRYNELVAMLPEAERYNVFYTVAHHSGLNPAPDKPSRTGKTFDYQTLLPFDIDAADPSRAIEYAVGVGKVLGVPAEALTVIRSGAGVHVIAHLQERIHTASYFEENRPFYKEILHQLGETLKELGLPFKLDPVVFEPARVLRMPGTMNVKPGRADTPCELVQFSDAKLSLDLKAISGMDKVEDENISPADIRRRFPEPDFQAMMDGCDFIKWTLSHPHLVHEPQAFDLFSLLAFQKKGVEATVGEEEMTPEQIGRRVFERAGSSASLQQVTFEEKWAQAVRYGGRKCSTIDERWEKGCSECPHWGKIPTPLALKSPEHIGSAINGYWVLGSKGQHLFPAYEDLSKLYRRENSYVVSSDERIWTFGGTHYKETQEIQVKGWLERTVKPTEPLRSAMRAEFVSKVLAVGVSEVDDKVLFEDRTWGRLNLANGILDICKGTLEPHTPDIGFKYVVPYAFDPNAESEYFLDWLSQITQNDVDLMDTLLDVMAYCLWPKYDDHVFVCLTGEGKNGKSTLINVMRAIMGHENCSAVGIQQLAANRFAPAQLEGKLCNLSEESSGYELSYEECNALKTLSSGGTMMVERKGVQGFEFTNRAKMIFAMNKRPTFREQGTALKRRLLVIPFPFTIDVPDPTIEEKLLAEVPGIAAMLLKRVRENVTRNGGKYRINRNLAVLEEAQKSMLQVGNSVIDWAKDHIESSAALDSELYVEVDAMYKAYREWAEESGIRNYAAKATFGRAMTDHVVTRAGLDERGCGQQKRIGGWNKRIYRHTRYLGEVRE